ncbi:uncharacterized protein LOC116931147 isoform X2 [Daphnia magna]|uniref:uncharacterized protein LOC116931147 isoform X2 n=1 Tax=Daphnia magna TaxID=35525 RepID=UPI001E1BADBE|nr:uncharacterized protein LOC116931147 isoform X2 [Daphnia magna]
MPAFLRKMVFGCCVPFFGSRSPNKKNISMFRAPRNPHLFLKWKQAIPEIEELKPEDRMCQLHFEGKYITCHKKIIVQGCVENIQLPRKQLKEGAVPSVWPQHPLFKVNPTLPLDEPQKERQQKAVAYERHTKKSASSIINSPTQSSRPLDVEAFLENENHAPQLPKNTILLPSGWNESHTQFSVQNLYSIL